ncbi:outer membrane protein [Methylobacterium sp. WSM2598]|uniref:outer membrane protein n=1 Tax=Methylobacterium sp. WSM2598 TaxID=398261 RepID=UPI0003A9E8B4|nr:outer membrane beta-barrel protein [Methylobacterium sp. WSM2598]
MRGWPDCRPVMALGFVLLGAAAAQAADLLPPALPPAPPPPAPVEIGGSWYLRGDFTASDFNRPGDDTLPGTPGAKLENLRLGSSQGGGGGIGYRVNSFLRADFTLDARGGTRFHDTSSRTRYVEGFNEEGGKLDVLTGLFNVYADLGTWWGFTPYVGAGVGFAEKRFHDGWTQTTCLTVTCGDTQPTYVIGPQTRDARASRTITTFAWAAMAGLSYDFGNGLSLDASYRYLDIGKARTGFDAYGGNTRLKDITANEVRVGLRWAFGAKPFGDLMGPPGAY